jgi:hypothetical protein
LWSAADQLPLLPCRNLQEPVLIVRGWAARREIDTEIGRANFEKVRARKQSSPRIARFLAAKQASAVGGFNRNLGIVGTFPLRMNPRAPIEKQ